MSIKIVLNGAGRIGKSILKQLLNDENFEIVAINEINPSIENIVYSINYDSTYGKLNDKFKVIENSFIQNQKSKIKITNYKDISELNLDGVDILIDASGQKTDLNKLRNLKVDKIILTHPQKDADINIVLGVNE
ncbi:MAG TPA: glyceraldehyde 3-phosphate dehydrogenase N-terminal domain-containing protein, partial [Aliarcobacter cryaerophilus]|nr:glyceraldehyde 3-phosphate dehydrogenase N-terminal domain-containing protein [Aliarcobacter cryaerophilus]